MTTVWIIVGIIALWGLKRVFFPYPESRHPGEEAMWGCFRD